MTLQFMFSEMVRVNKALPVEQARQERQRRRRMFLTGEHVSQVLALNLQKPVLADLTNIDTKPGPLSPLPDRSMGEGYIPRHYFYPEGGLGTINTPQVARKFINLAIKEHLENHLPTARAKLNQESAELVVAAYRRVIVDVMKYDEVTAKNFEMAIVHATSIPDDRGTITHVCGILLKAALKEQPIQFFAQLCFVAERWFNQLIAARNSGDLDKFMHVESDAWPEAFTIAAMEQQGVDPRNYGFQASEEYAHAGAAEKEAVNPDRSAVADHVRSIFEGTVKVQPNRSVGEPDRDLPVLNEEDVVKTAGSDGQMHFGIRAKPEDQAPRAEIVSWYIGPVSPLEINISTLKSMWPDGWAGMDGAIAALKNGDFAMAINDLQTAIRKSKQAEEETKAVAQPPVDASPVDQASVNLGKAAKDVTTAQKKKGKADDSDDKQS